MCPVRTVENNFLEQSSQSSHSIFPFGSILLPKENMLQVAYDDEESKESTTEFSATMVVPTLSTIRVDSPPVLAAKLSALAKQRCRPTKCIPTVKRLVWIQRIHRPLVW